MERLIKPFIATTLVLYILVQLLSLSFRQKPTLRTPERIIVALAAPAQRVVGGMFNSTAEFWNHYLFLAGASKENEKLRNEIAQLRRLLLEQKDIESENLRLRTLLDLGKKIPFDSVVATRVASGVSPYERTIRITRGKKEGVSQGMPVITAAGVVGQILEVVGTNSDVLLLVDGASAIDVVVLRSRARGILRGEKMDELRFEFLPKDADVKVGDELVSSGLDGVYPPGLPVGIVSQVQTIKKELFLSARVKPQVDFTRLEEVAILLTGTK